MLFIKNKKPALNTQSDPIKAKPFILQCTGTFTRALRYIMNPPKVFFFEFENDGMEPTVETLFFYIVALYS